MILLIEILHKTISDHVSTEKI